MFYRSDGILQNIPHIKYECEEHSPEMIVNYEIFLTFNVNVRNIP